MLRPFMFVIYFKFQWNWFHINRVSAKKLCPKAMKRTIFGHHCTFKLIHVLLKNLNNPTFVCDLLLKTNNFLYDLLLKTNIFVCDLLLKTNLFVCDRFLKTNIFFVCDLLLKTNLVVYDKRQMLNVKYL